MTGGFNPPKPEFDIEATVERAMALINRTLQPSLEEAQKVVDKVRAGKPLVAPGDLVNQVTRGNRIRAARAVSYSLPSIIPGYGTAISAAAVPVALREVLNSHASPSSWSSPRDRSSSTRPGRSVPTPSWDPTRRCWDEPLPTTPWRP